jgi:ribonuclease E
VLCQVPVDVASFLLNEKRSEISKIEMKQRINVLLVPNKTLETPNYRLERLKHDDPRLDNIEASYKMAEEIEDPTLVTRRSQEKHNKQEPIIKGVLPDAPAPVAAPRPVAAAPAPVAAPVPAPAPRPAPVAVTPEPAEKGFFGWIKNLFGAEPAPAPVPAPVVAAKADERPAGEARRDGRGERGERTERGERGGRDGRRGGRGRTEGRDGQPRADGPARADGRSEGRPEGRADARGEVRGDARTEGRPEGRPEGRGEGRGGERRERNPDARNEAGRQERPAGENRNEANAEGRSESREPREPREPREGGRGGRGRRDGADRAERGGERPPRDAVEQDIAAANQAAMAAAMGGDTGEAGGRRQDRPVAEAGRESERPQGDREPRGEGRRERGERGGRGGERNGRRNERPDGQTASPDAVAVTLMGEQAPMNDLPGMDLTEQPRNGSALPASGQGDRIDGQVDGPINGGFEGNTQGGEPRQPRRSRDRYGRDRRDGERNGNGGGNDRPADQTAENSVAAVNSESNQPPAQSERAPAAMNLVVPAADTVAVATPVAPVAPARQSAPAAAPAVAPVAASAGLPKVQAYDLPMQDLSQVAQSSGLQWVNSDAAKIAEVNAAIAAEAKPIHVPRERAAVPVSTEGPLVLVETKRDLAAMPLPFEKPAA